MKEFEVNIELDLDDNKVFRLANSVRELAEEDGNSEFDGVRWMYEELIRDEKELSMLSIKGAKRAVCAQLLLTEARLRGRKARRDGNDISTCPHSSVVSGFDVPSKILRNAWISGFHSYEPSLSIQVNDPADELDLLPMMSLPIISTNKFGKMIGQLDAQYPGIKNQVLQALAKVAIDSASKPSTKNNGSKEIACEATESTPACTVKYRANRSFVEAYEVSLQLNFDYK